MNPCMDNNPACELIQFAAYSEKRKAFYANRYAVELQESIDAETEAQHEGQ
jgi:hypothetical protein